MDKGLQLHACPDQSRLLDDLFLPAIPADEQKKFLFFIHPFLVVLKKEVPICTSLLALDFLLFNLIYLPLLGIYTSLGLSTG